MLFNRSSKGGVSKRTKVDKKANFKKQQKIQQRHNRWRDEDEEDDEQYEEYEPYGYSENIYGDNDDPDMDNDDYEGDNDNEIPQVDEVIIFEEDDGNENADDEQDIDDVRADVEDFLQEEMLNNKHVLDNGEGAVEDEEDLEDDPIGQIYAMAILNAAEDNDDEEGDEDDDLEEDDEDDHDELDDEPVVNEYQGFIPPSSNWKPDRVPADIAPWDFYEKYVATRTPCIIKGPLTDKSWFASQLWNPAYLSRVAGDAIVEVETRDPETDEQFGAGGLRRKVLFKDFIADAQSGDTSLYLTTQYGNADEDDDDEDEDYDGLDEDDEDEDGLDEDEDDDDELDEGKLD
ncbi:hypothetical protein HDU76_009116 [Blyttiomyces sp. JEL0837]|nr:hypothetical protein HDU76_009116 [Blyttiomyces sp. JEL0837]